MSIVIGELSSTKQKGPTSRIVEIDADVAWRAWRSRDSGEWVAECTSLGLTATGTTWADLHAYIAEVQQHLFRDVAKEGDAIFRRFLETHGFRVISRSRLPAQRERLRFDVPFRVERLRVRERVNAA